MHPRTLVVIPALNEEEALPGVLGDLAAHAPDFDVLVVASGHNWEPRLPEPPYPGSFDGREVHAHDYREAEEL